MHMQLWLTAHDPGVEAENARTNYRVGQKLYPFIVAIAESTLNQVS